LQEVIWEGINKGKKIKKKEKKSILLSVWRLFFFPL
jgi:hypothetical protein